MSRFGYVRYDASSLNDQEELKAAAIAFEKAGDALLPDGRAKSLFFTKLEEAYMWAGKGIRDAQIARNGSAKLQEERKDG